MIGHVGEDPVGRERDGEAMRVGGGGVDCRERFFNSWLRQRVKILL